MNNEVQDKTYIPLTPFKGWVIENFPFIEANFDAITNYELICQLTKYLNDVISNQNQVQSLGSELVSAYNDLLDYVNNYFENLDVQEEINNKLDDMALDGSLTELIKNYIDPIFDTEFNAFKNIVNVSLNTMESQITGAASGSPLVASSTSEMTNTSRIYVNTTDGKWYYYNGSAWAIGGTYQASGISVTDNDRIYKLEGAVEKLTYAPTITGSYIDNNGTIQSNANFKRTDYIPVGYMNKIKYQTVVGSSLKEVLFLNAGKEIVDSIAGRNTSFEKIADIPDNTVYVVLQIYTNNAEGFNLPYITLYNDELLRADVENLNNKFEKTINPVTIEPTIYGYGEVATNKINTATTGLHTDFIELDEDDVIEYQTNMGGSGYELMYYDENLVFISGIDGTQNRQVQKRTAPETAKYVIMCYYISATYPNKWIKIYNKNAVDIRIKDAQNNISDKNILIFGDSITDCCNITVNANNETTAYTWKNPSNSYVNDDNQTIRYSMWPKIINENYGCKEIRNYAKAGASYQTKPREVGDERQNLVNQIDLAFNDKLNPNNVFNQADFNPDIIIFFLGTNDNPNDTFDEAMEKTVLVDGTQTIDVDATLENLDPSKFNEAIRYSLLKVKKEWPLAQIFVILPIQRADDKDIVSINSQIKEMAQRCGCIIIDGYSDSGITRELNVVNGLGLYLKDGLHPNEKGQNLLTRMVIKELNSKYKDFEYMNN